MLICSVVWGQRNRLDINNTTTTALVGGPIASISLEGTADSIWVHDSGTLVAAGDSIAITGTGDGAYDITHLVLDADVDSFLVAATYTLTGTGTYGEVYTGTATDLLKPGHKWGSVGISVYNAHTGAISTTLQVQFSQDKSNWNSNYSTTVTDETNTTVAYSTESRYYRVRYLNVTVDQGAFRLESILYETDQSVSGFLADSTLTISGTVTANVANTSATPLFTDEVLDTDLTRADTVLNAGNSITTLSALLSSQTLTGGGFTITNEQSGETLVVGSSSTNTGAGSTNSGTILLYKESFSDWINFFTSTTQPYIKGSAATTMFRLQIAHQ